MTHLHPYISGVPLTDIGAFSEVTYTENFRRGAETAEWVMDRHLTHDTRLRAGALVIIRDTATSVWRGILAQPSLDGKYRAYGRSELGNGPKAIDGSNNPTMKPQTAVAAAIARGAVPWFAGPTLSNTDVSGAADNGLTVSGLLDAYSDETGLEWRIDHNGFVVTQAQPTSPSWAVMLHDVQLVYEDSDYVTHLNVDYLATGPVFTTILGVTTTTSAAAAAAMGRVEKTLDLTGFGVMTSGQANARAQAFLAKVGPKMVMSDPLELAHGQLRTLGDTEAHWSGVHAGQMIRLWGVPDKSQPVATLHTDIVIGRVQRTPTTLTLTQYGAGTQSYEDHVAELYAALTREALKA